MGHGAQGAQKESRLGDSLSVSHPRKQCKSETAKGEKKRVSRLIPSLADFQVHVFQRTKLRRASAPKGKEWRGEP